MSAEEEMDFQSLPSPSIDVAPLFPAHHQSITRRRGHSLNSSHVHSPTRTSTRTTSTPKPSRRRRRHRSNQPSINNPPSSSTNERHGNLRDSFLSPIPPSDPPRHSQLQASSLPFDCPSDDEQRQKQNITVTTRSGKIKKDTVLSYFTLRVDKKYDCNICHQVLSVFSLKIT
jgi:hypothetical protein